MGNEIKTNKNKGQDRAYKERHSLIVGSAELYAVGNALNEIKAFYTTKHHLFLS